MAPGGVGGAGARPVTRLTLYSRRGCHLCEEMILDLELARRGRDWTFDVVDVDGDAALAARYGERVPVLTAGERELCAGRLDPASLEKI